MKTKPSSCPSLHPVQKNRQEVKFTFNVAKSDRIFDKLVKIDNIELTHTILPMDELKRHTYCKWLIKAKAKTSSLEILARRTYCKEGLLGRL
jgi:hypothetical protein